MSINIEKVKSVRRYMSVKIDICCRKVGVIGGGDGGEVEFEIGIEVGYRHGSSVDKGTKGGVYVRVLFSVGWDVVRGVGSRVDRDISCKVVISDYGGVEL